MPSQKESSFEFIPFGIFKNVESFAVPSIYFAKNGDQPYVHTYTHTQMDIHIVCNTSAFLFVSIFETNKGETKKYMRIAANKNHSSYFWW